ncbi:AhpC/TSA family protein [bacterium]|nr:AhpC/TSA family protein [bacterium]
MKTMKSVSLVVALLLALAGCRQGVETVATEPAVPSYREAVEAFQKSRPPSKLSDEDRATMAKAAADLQAQMPSPGLEPGDRAPDFALPNALGKTVRLSEELRKGPVVLAFYRGAWCPYCNLELRALRESLPAFEARGATLIAVTPQKPGKSREEIEKEGYAFEILSDLDSAVMKKYKLYFDVPKDLSDLYKQRFGLDIADYNGEGRTVLPVPGTLVIDRSGIVRAAYARTDYKQRMEPAAIVAALDKIVRKP